MQSWDCSELSAKQLVTGRWELNDEQWGRSGINTAAGATGG